MDAGKRLFAAQGLKKTSLEQLTAANGIAKSTFYAFYDARKPCTWICWSWKWPGWRKKRGPL
ncbi:TetR/AcrR family transcriptional regulator [Paenibacillus sp. OAE614]|uniref:TetR/AcrR family transcriptional regulator n=1 Tax=Paenibacillus sp. OAE614 TaxID=2663804 RepID=UPI003396F006